MIDQPKQTNPSGPEGRDGGPRPEAMISQVSFVVISLNEERFIGRCLSALAGLITEDCEVICVDCDSADRTREIIASFRNRITDLSLYVLSGGVSPAAARNAGLEAAVREHIFFVDGDTELDPGFLPPALAELKEGRCAGVVGSLLERQYPADPGSTEGVMTVRNDFDSRRLIRLTGGIFLALAAAVRTTGRFDERLHLFEDWDYTLRFTRRFKMLALPAPMGAHHTVPYHAGPRLLEAIRRRQVRDAGVLLRKHLGRPGELWLILKEASGIAFGLLFYLVLILLAVAAPRFLWIGGGLVLLDTLYGAYRRKKMGLRLTHHYLSPWFVLWGFLFRPSGRNHEVTKIF